IRDVALNYKALATGELAETLLSMAEKETDAADEAFGSLADIVSGCPELASDDFCGRIRCVSESKKAVRAKPAAAALEKISKARASWELTQPAQGDDVPRRPKEASSPRPVPYVR
ncbi:MAG: hypothetical protein PHE27_04525, partial [Alphaproteobacteria bacterium]|nr:hypothetical protein [Alphaproteobacteria bacterium]